MRRTSIVSASSVARHALEIGMDGHFSTDQRFGPIDSGRIYDQNAGNRVVKTAATVEVAGIALSLRFDDIDEGVFVAVQEHVDDFLKIPALFAFDVDFILRCRPVGGNAGLKRL